MLLMFVGDDVRRLYRGKFQTPNSKLQPPPGSIPRFCSIAVFASFPRPSPPKEKRRSLSGISPSPPLEERAGERRQISIRFYHNSPAASFLPITNSARNNPE